MSKNKLPNNGEDTLAYNECGCYAKDGYNFGDEPFIVHCPLHAAAAELLDALKTWDEFWKTMPKGQMGKLTFNVGLFNDGFIKMSKALKAAAK